MKTIIDAFVKFLPTLLTAIGAFVLGHNIMGQTIDENVWQEITGALMSVVGLIMAIRSFTATIEMVQATIRQVILFVGSFLVATGKLKEETVIAILGVATAIAPLIYSHFSRKKTQGLDNGNINIQQLKQ